MSRSSLDNVGVEFVDFNDTIVCFLFATRSTIVVRCGACR